MLICLYSDSYTINEYQIAFSSYQTQHKLNLCLQGLFDIYNRPSECLNLFRKLYTPTSTIYHAPEIDKGLSDRLTSSQFDLSKPSGKNKELKPMVATMLLADKGELGPSVVTRLENIYFLSVEVVTKAYCNGTVSDLSDLIL